MTVELSAEDQQLLQRLVDAGEFASLEEALHAAIEGAQNKHDAWLEYARHSIQEGLDDVVAGRLVDGEEAMKRLKARASRTAA
jgi:Arc/MetJ-type ribon-helix-helix transcriptional regulator